ncbi:MAG TPA: N-acetylmuramoyl-L-alanine amidase [Candidatus Acidoferrales bacterium]|nr:N-acetylmuramoyl-L-alanine amidase [Candidatus Acidoferrales bacterium]
MRHNAATIRPILRAVFASAVILCLFSPLSLKNARADEDAASRRDMANSQFDRAEKARQALEARPESARSLKDYTAVVIEYQRVYLTTSHAENVPASINEVAELFRTMGDLFDAKYYQRSIESFHFLLKEYPASKYREDALLNIARIQQDDLHDSAAAQESYEDFLSAHPRSAHASEVRASLDKINAANTATAKSSQATPLANARANRSSAKNISAEKLPPTTDTKPGSPDDASSENSSTPQVSRIRTWNADTYTRIVIDVGSKVKYQAARITAPDRIYFDIEGAKINSALLRKPIDVESPFLKTVRVAQYQSGVARVVLEINHVSDFSVFLLPDPYRLVVDVYGTPAAAEAAARETAPAAGPAALESAANAKSDKPSATTSSAKPSMRAGEKSSAKSPFVPPPDAPVLMAQPKFNTSTSTSATASADTADAHSAARKVANLPMKPPPTSTPAKNAKSDKADADMATAATNIPTTSATADTTVLPLPTRPLVTKKSGKNGKSAKEQAEEMGPPTIPDLTLDGQHSLTRALGLKIGRIVIDAGHGGHDTGTIGPTGLMEKDLCLDVALRLGKSIQQRLPSAEVVFTRDDDTFIALERRTEIANEAKADLFISVHANSSQDRQARGIETYYLNFTGSSDAMEVASRENALSENAVHDLQNLVTKIARNEKIEESRDLATMIQESLSKRMENINRGERNRGVRKAPFVVLIGADMPSVLAEISFLSNPSDEQWLKKPDNRQKVADGLYRGIESYLQSTNSLAANQSRATVENISGKVARTGNSQ